MTRFTIILLLAACAPRVCAPGTNTITIREMRIATPLRTCYIESAPPSPYEDGIRHSGYQMVEMPQDIWDAYRLALSAAIDRLDQLTTCILDQGGSVEAVESAPE